MARVAGDAFGVCWQPDAQGARATLEVFAAPFVHAQPLDSDAGAGRLCGCGAGAGRGGGLLKRPTWPSATRQAGGRPALAFLLDEMEANTRNRVQLLNELRSTSTWGVGWNCTTSRRCRPPAARWWAARR